MYPMGTISGVVQLADGTPVAGAFVGLGGYKYQEKGKRFRQIHTSRSRASAVAADEEGRFTINNLQIDTPAVQYKLLAKAENYPLKITEELLDVGATDVVIILTPGSTISGTVMNATTQEPIPALKLSIQAQFQMGEKEVTSAEDGSFSFANVGAGQAIISTNSEQLVAIEESNKIEAVEGEDINDVVLLLNTGAMVAGRVYDKVTERGIPGVEISARPENIPNARYKSVKTDARGDFLFEGLYQGSYRIRYNRIDGYPNNRSWQDEKNVALALGQRTVGIDFPVEQGMTISGIVVDLDGKPIQGVNLNGNDRQNHYDRQETNEKGRFVLAGFVPQSNVIIKAQKSDLASLPMTIKVEDTNVVDVRVEMKTAAKISGIIVDTRGEPMPEANIFTSSEDDEYGQSSRANDGGKFTIDGLSAGTYNLKPIINNSWNSRHKTLASITLEEGEHKEDVRIVWDVEQGKMTIKGRVTDDRGDAVKDARLWAHSQNGGSGFDARTDENGDYVLDGLQEGSYNINFNRMGYSSGNLRNIAAGSTNADIVVDRTGTITGKIVQASNGEAITDFRILLLNSNQRYSGHMERQFKSYHHNEGYFEVKNAYPGYVSLVVRAAGFAELTHTVDGIQSAETTDNVVIEMESGKTLTGTVSDYNGNTIRGAKIFIGKVPRSSWERDNGAKATSNAQGKFELDGLPEGDVEIGAHSAGFLSDSVTVSMTSGQNHVDLVLQEGATVEGYVYLDGKPKKNANVYAHINSDSVQIQTDEKGFYQLKGVGIGQGNLQAGFNDPNSSYRNMSTSIETATGMVTEYSFDFKDANSSVEGYIKVAEDKTSAGQVNLQVNTGDTQESRHLQVGADGHYLFEGIPAGKVTLNAYGTSVQTRKAATGEVGENEVLHLDIELYGGSTINVSVNNIPQGRQVYFMVLKGEVALPETFNETTLTELSMNTVSSGSIGPEGTGTVGMIEPGQYTIVAGAYDLSGGRPNFETLIMTSSTLTVKKDQEHSVNLSF